MNYNYNYIVIVLVIFIAVMLIAPPLLPVPDPYSAYNIYWNGYSKAVHVCNASISYYRISNASVIIMIPMIKPSVGFVNQLINFTRSGGTLIILSNGIYYGNYILKTMGIDASISETPIVDPIMNYINEHLPLAVINSKYADVIGAKYIVLDNSSYILISNGYNYDVITWTSSYSMSGDLKGPFPVIVSIPYGNGTVILIADPSIFMNSLLNYYGNEQLLKWLCSGKRVIYLEGFIEKVTPLAFLRMFDDYLYAGFSAGGIKYLLITLPLILLIIWIIVRGIKVR
ncbi:MAG: DUF4350 domain-containing protein [Vulcanisaeta sp.]